MQSNLFEIMSWDETTIHESDNGAKHTRAKIGKTYRGELQGQGALEYLLAYRPDGSADFVGLEHFVGKLGDKEGSFAMTHSGTFNQGSVVSDFVIISGSGAESLSEIAGSGSYKTGEGREVPFELLLNE